MVKNGPTGEPRQAYDFGEELKRIVNNANAYIVGGTVTAANGPSHKLPSIDGRINARAPNLDVRAKALIRHFIEVETAKSPTLTQASFMTAIEGLLRGFENGRSILVEEASKGEVRARVAGLRVEESNLGVLVERVLQAGLFADVEPARTSDKEPAAGAGWTDAMGGGEPRGDKGRGA